MEGVHIILLTKTLLQKYSLPIVHDTSFQVIIVDRERIKCVDHCLALTLMIQDHVITTNFYELPIVAC